MRILYHAAIIWLIVWNITKMGNSIGYKYDIKDVNNPPNEFQHNYLKHNTNDESIVASSDGEFDTNRFGIHQDISLLALKKRCQKKGNKILFLLGYS